MYVHWVQSSQARVFPTGNRVGLRSFSMHAARNESLSFQACLHRIDGQDTDKVRLAVCAQDGIETRIRLVGFVPVPHHNTDVPDSDLDCLGHIPGYVPDPLFDETQTLVAPGETVAFWVTVKVSEQCPTGTHTLSVVFTVHDEESEPLEVVLVVHQPVVQTRNDFQVTQWFYNDALLDWYGLAPFEEQYWRVLRPYIQDQSEHGQDTVYVPIFTPPTDGVKRPSQLVRVRRQGGAYTFGFQDVKRYVDLARECGIRKFEWTHLFSQWGVEHPIRIYRDQGAQELLLWDPSIPATSAVYRRFLSQFMPEFQQFLEQESLVDTSIFHVSDEPHGDAHRENYRRARALLRDVAPWMKTMDALSEIEYGRQRITDMPIASIRVAKQFVDSGIPCYGYFCCGPRGLYPNRLMDTPLTKIRSLGWQFYRFRIRGFLHWGYNYWYKSQTRRLIDPFTVSDALAWPAWAFGDPFLVYPGVSGPIDSVRWEIFAEGLADYALLQTLGVDPDSEVLRVFEDFSSFPKDEHWYWLARKHLLSSAE